MVRFHIEHICQQPTVRHIRKELDKFRDSSSASGLWPLDPTYDRAMSILYSQTSNRRELGLTILSWLAHAKQPLTIEKFGIAISIEPERYELDEHDLSGNKTLLDVCASLVTKDENSRIVRLAHYTIREYLLRRRIPEDASFRVAIGCTTYLAFDIFTHVPTWASEYQHNMRGFLLYVLVHFKSHIMECKEELTVGFLLRVLKNPGLYIHIDWLHSSPQEFFSFIYGIRMHQFTRLVHRMHTCIYFPLLWAFETKIDSTDDLDSLSESYFLRRLCQLLVTSALGHYSATQRLLAQGEVGS